MSFQCLLCLYTCHIGVFVYVCICVYVYLYGYVYVYVLCLCSLTLARSQELTAKTRQQLLDNRLHSTADAWGQKYPFTNLRCLSASFQCLDRPMEKTPPMYSWCKQACKMQSPKLRALSFITVLLCSRFVLFFHQDFRKVLGRVKPTYLTIREQILRWKYYLPDNLTY